MKHFWPWLGISAFTVAHPVFNSDDRFTGTDNGFVWTDEAANTNIEQTNPSSWQDSQSPYHVFDVAAKEEKHTPEESQPPMSREALRLRVQRLLKDVYNGKYDGVTIGDLSQMIDNEVTNFREKKITEIDHQIGPVDWNVLSGQFDRLFGKDWPKEISGQGTQGLTQNIFSMPGLTPENLLKFIFTTTFVGPKIDLGLQGIDITGAIFDALPGFIGELWGNWLPAGL